MLFNYTSVDEAGSQSKGTIEAVNKDVALRSLQRRGLIVSSILGEKESRSLFNINLTLFSHVNAKDVVILSRQISTLFEAQVSALRIFRLLADEAIDPIIRSALEEVANDLQGGSAISGALSKHPAVFSPFYVNMVLAGEESGKLDETFNYLAEHLDRTYEVTSKARNALVYPVFVLVTFVAVMILMLTLVIPKLSEILLEAGGEIPLYTRVVIGTSDFFVHYGVFLLALMVMGVFFLYRMTRSPEGQYTLDSFQLSIPYVGDLYRKLYLSRIADNLNTMLSSGIPVVRALEVTSSVVGSAVYKEVIDAATEAIKGGGSISRAFAKYPEEMPGVLIQMVRVGEETGQLGSILKTLSKFYSREVTNAVDTLVSLIEPIMILFLGLGVGVLLASILIPIYNLTAVL